jgi:hypothetical protein
LGEITLDLRLVIKIPSSKLTINGLVLGLKQSAPQIHAAILTTLLEALEEKAVERQIEKDPQRYRRPPPCVRIVVTCDPDERRVPATPCGAPALGATLHRFAGRQGA